jgi:hypothetical protein
VTGLNTIEPTPTHAAHAKCVSGSCTHTSGYESSQGETNNAPDRPSEETADASHQETMEMLGKLPPEIGMLLIISGIAGVLLPGPVGMPLLIAGGVTMWPKTFEPIERWFSRRFPVVHREGVFQIKEFISDLRKRYPDKSK